NLRSESIGYLLKSLMGAVDSDPVGGQAGAYDHVFTVLPNDPEHPSLTFALSQPGQQDYKYPLAVVTSIEFKVAPNDLVMATINFIAQKEAEKGAPAYEPTFGSTDVYFRQQDVHFYLADVGDDLAGGAEVLLKDFVLTIPNGGRADQNISEYNPGNVIAGTFAPKGSMTLDELDKTYHDFFTGGTYKALRMSMERLDVTIGSSTHPKLIVDLFKVSVEGWDPDRPIDDVVKQKLELKVHYSEDDAKALEITLRNSTADYDAEPGS
ncbi:MAG TPA: phage tail tube protein, partial [Alphaproteobacteria bacterium]